MAVIGAGDLDKRIRFERATNIRDELGGQGVSAWALLFNVWANKTDVQDSEKFAVDERSATLSVRWTVRSSTQVKGVTPKDRIIYEGLEYEIMGVKETGHGRNKYVEFSTAVRIDDGA